MKVNEKNFKDVEIVEEEQAAEKCCKCKTNKSVVYFYCMGHKMMGWCKEHCFFPDFDIISINAKTDKFIRACIKERGNKFEIQQMEKRGFVEQMKDLGVI